MKVSPLLTILLQLFLVMVSGLCGSLAFSFSGLGLWLKEMMTESDFGLASSLPVLVWTFLVLVGVLLVLVRSSGGGLFTCIVILFSLPSILSLNKINILEIFKYRIEITTEFGLMEIFLLSTTIMLCYLLLVYLLIYKNDGQSMLKKGVPAEDVVKIVKSAQHLVFLIFICVIFVAGFIFLVSFGLKTFMLALISGLPWYTGLIFIGSILVLAVYIYWLGFKREKGS